MLKIIHNGLFQRFNTSKDSSTNALLGNLREESLDLVDPRGTGWREMDVPVGMFQEPLFHAWRFMGRTVVHDDVNFLIQRHLVGNGVVEEMLRRNAVCALPVSPFPTLAGPGGAQPKSEVKA